MSKRRQPQVAEDLAERMCGMEEAAFEEFSLAFLPFLAAFYCKGGAPASDAEDLALLCVSEVCLNIGSYGKVPGAEFSNWVMRIARNKRADWQRKHYESPQPIPYDDLIETVSFDREQLPADKVVQAAIRDAMNRLSCLQRLILELLMKDYVKKSPDIGKILRVPASTVRVEHRRALQRLKASLERDPRMSKRLLRVKRSEVVSV